MYSRPSVQRFGTLRELTLGGSTANYDVGQASNATCGAQTPFCLGPIPNHRS